MEYQDLLIYAKDVIKKHPDIEGEIKDLIDLCETEIEDGGSVEHEINLCISSIDDLLIK